MRARLALSPGAPERPVMDGERRAKLELCAGPAAGRLAELLWESATRFLRAELAG